MDFARCPTLISKIRGFSAVELLVVIAILGVLSALAAPSFSVSIDRYRVNALRDELIATIQLARMESMRRGIQVSLTRKVGCGATLVGTDDWSCGYELFVDTNANGTKNSGEEVLKTASIPNNYGLMHPSQGANMRMNIWGQAQNTGNKFVLTPPSGVASPATTAICISTGGRIRTIAESASCP